MHRDETTGIEGKGRLVQPLLRAGGGAPDCLVVLDRRSVGAVQVRRSGERYTRTEDRLDTTPLKHALKNVTHALRVLRHQPATDQGHLEGRRPAASLVDLTTQPALH